MLKLYYKPGACSLAAHIILREAGEPFELEKVDTARGVTETGADYSVINPKGYVPALELEDGQVLTEGAAVLQYIAAGHPGQDLARHSDRLAQARVQEQLNFIASEVHQAFGPLFAAQPPTGKARDAVVAGVARQLDRVEHMLADGRRFLVADAFSVADAYLFVVASWTAPTGIGLQRWPNLERYVERIASRETTRAAMRAEGLIAEQAA